jgi:hypothetical protein
LDDRQRDPEEVQQQRAEKFDDDQKEKGRHRDPGCSRELTGPPYRNRQALAPPADQ